jgi:hypothetical protein
VKKINDETIPVIVNKVEGGINELKTKLEQIKSLDAPNNSNHYQQNFTDLQTSLKELQNKIQQFNASSLF